MKKRRAPALLLSLWLVGCSDADLPPRYRELEVPEARLRSVEAVARGRALFQEHCALCHGERADGRGRRREAFTRPPAAFTDPGWQARMSARRVFMTIREGVRGTAMPGWSSLEERETWDLVAYLRSLSRGGP